MLQAFLRRFAESATAFASKYRRDVFYRTGWNVVVLQVGFATVLLAIVFVSLSLLYDQIIAELVGSITRSLAEGTSPSTGSFSIAANLEYEKLKNMVLTATGILMAAVVFSWLITRMALTPTREALESQKQFIGNVAHEVRTPLSIIKTNTEVALFNERLDRDTREALVSNVEELNRISDIINNLLSMSALLRPERMEFADTDLGPVVVRAVDVLSDLATHKGITVTVAPRTRGIVRGNAAALDQIVTNILKNALAYTPSGGTVKIAVEQSYIGKLELRITDNGIGIEEKDLERIFEPFYRGDQSRNRKAGGGSGLGLAIVSELVKVHKGSIAIRSAPGRGTEVSVLFPLGRSRAKATRPGVGIDFSAQGRSEAGTS